MKRRICLCCLLACAVALASGCSKKEPLKTESESVSSFKTADELIQEAEAREQEQKQSAVPQGSEDNAPGDAAGVYACAMEGTDQAYWPSLELEADGNATLNANLYTGMGIVKGTFTLRDKTVRMTVDQVSFTGFVGEDVTDLVFDFIDADTLQLAYSVPDTQVGSTMVGDQFKRQAADG